MGGMIEIQDLTKRFGSFTAVDHVSFEVQRGEVLGFLGPNGAGKSTTMKMITGFLPPTSGRALVCGHDVTQAPQQAKERLGYLPEGAPAYPDMSARAFLRFAAEVRGMKGAEARRAIDAVVQQVQLESVLKQPIETLSKGYKRRVGLAQAILHDPEVLIMDEPTDGLDPNQKHEVRQLIRGMAADKAIVISTHILEEVEAVCTRAVVIRQGSMAFDGTPAELEARSRYCGAVRIAVDGLAPESVRYELGALPGVSAAELDGAGACIAFPSAGGAIVEAVTLRAREAGWAIRELRVERGRLEEVFRELTGAGASAESGAAPAHREVASATAQN